MKLYKVFTAGKYPQGDITEDDLKSIAENYDPDYHEAPLTLNHKSEGPSLGWVNKVVAKGKDLFVGFKDVNEDAKKITSKGEYKRPSIEISNYEGKGKYLRAVSLVLFPAVKGLPEMQFKTADGEAVIYFSEGEINFNKLNNIKMDITKFSEKLGLSESATVEDVVNSFNEKFDEKVKEVETLTDEVKTLKDNAKKFEEEKISSLVSNALASGKITKAQEESIKTFATSNYDACKKYVESLPVQNIYKNDQSKTKSPEGKSKEVSYQDILKDPSLSAQFSEEELEDLRVEYLK
jgi:phage I-like protein